MLFGLGVNHQLLVLDVEDGVRARALDVGRSSAGGSILLLTRLYFDALSQEVDHLLHTERFDRRQPHDRDLPASTT